jgi:hypothetical protein
MNLEQQDIKARNTEWKGLKSTVVKPHLPLKSTVAKPHLPLKSTVAKPHLPLKSTVVNPTSH